jgi:death-on-curing protein
MSEPVFLNLQEILFLHERSIARYGGTLGIRDRPGLEAAVNQPLNVWFYMHGDLFDMAAAYMFHIAEAQAFLDGNKRTAVAAGLNFLAANNIEIDFDAALLYEAMIKIGTRRMSKSELAAELRSQGRGSSHQ